MTAAEKEIIRKAKKKYQDKLVKGNKGTFRVNGVWLIYTSGIPKIEVSISQHRVATTPISVTLGELEREFQIVE
jgi:hypothetical protein